MFYQDRNQYLFINGSNRSIVVKKTKVNVFVK